MDATSLTSIVIAAEGGTTSWDLVIFVLTHPWFLFGLLLIVVLAYCVLRTQGYDLVSVVLQKIGITAVKNEYDIAAKWEYRCTGIDRELEQGGECIIEFIQTSFGVQWKLAGRRFWIKEFSPDHPPTVIYLDPIVMWESDYGAIIDRTHLVFTYRITPRRLPLNGFADAHIEHSADGKANAFEGHFYQLPPSEPVYGTCQFRRMLHDDDHRWFPVQQPSVAIRA